jgi:hypothetical protein
VTGMLFSCADEMMKKIITATEARISVNGKNDNMDPKIHLQVDIIAIFTPRKIQPFSISI